MARPNCSLLLLLSFVASCRAVSLTANADTLAATDATEKALTSLKAAEAKRAEASEARASMTAQISSLEHKRENAAARLSKTKDREARLVQKLEDMAQKQTAREEKERKRVARGWKHFNGSKLKDQIKSMHMNFSQLWYRDHEAPLGAIDISKQAYKVATVFAGNLDGVQEDINATRDDAEQAAKEIQEAEAAIGPAKAQLEVMRAEEKRAEEAFKALASSIPNAESLLKSEKFLADKEDQPKPASNAKGLVPQGLLNKSKEITKGIFQVFSSFQEGWRSNDTANESGSAETPV